MKRKIIYSFVVLILTLTSCYSKRTNIIVDGHYHGVDLENQLVSCDLFIEQISEDDYLVSNGKNVIKDAINNNYYSIELIINFSENNMQQIDFINFKDAYDGTSGIPISYVDDNDCWLTPFTSQNNVVRPDAECYYSINVKIGNSKLFAYLYAKENEYLVLSPNRAGAGTAYLDITFPNAVSKFSFTASMWSSLEGAINEDFKVQYYDGGLIDHIKIDSNDLSTLKDYPDSFKILFPKDTNRIRFYATHSTPNGGRNKGRMLMIK